jgi:hypothetical protein
MGRRKPESNHLRCPFCVLEVADVTLVGSDAASGRSARMLRPLYWVVVAASVGWTIANSDRFGTSIDEAGDVTMVVGLMGSFVALWILGLAMVCFCAAARTARSFFGDPLAWVRSFPDLARASTSVLADLAGSRAFWLGWWVSWVATTLVSLLPAIVAIARLGSTGLGFVGMAVASIGVNFAWRLPIDARMRRLRASSRGTEPVSLSGMI